MSQLTERNINILKIIIDEYIHTGDVIGSKLLLKKYDLGVSPATIRNDMAKLEHLDLVFQPYNSAGRMPTAKGLRAFVNYLMAEIPDHFLNEKNSAPSFGDNQVLASFIHSLSFELSQKTKEISFFLVPEKSLYSSSGIADFLESNFDKMGNDIFKIVRIIEDKNSFSHFIENLVLSDGVNVFIGEENVIPFLKDYTIIVKKITINKSIGYIGIIGSLKMDYNFNISAIKGII